MGSRVWVSVVPADGETGMCMLCQSVLVTECQAKCGEGEPCIGIAIGGTDTGEALGWQLGSWRDEEVQSSDWRGS